MKTKRFLSILLVMCLLLALLPAAALATGTDKAIQLSESGAAANIPGAQASNVYFGTYQQSAKDGGGYNVDPIKWRVLQNTDGKLLLLSDQNLDVVQYHEDDEAVTWERSTMRSWLNGYAATAHDGSSGTDFSADNFLGTAFSTGEQAAIPAVTVVNDNNPEHGTAGGNTTTDKAFLLSLGEAKTTAYGFTDNYSSTESRVATNTAYVAGGGKTGGAMNGAGAANLWWLRSPGNDADLAAIVNDDGYVFNFGSNVYRGSVAVRPALNIDLNSVLFTSAAEGGKISGAAGADALSEISDYTGTDWKLTLLDGSRSFTVTETAVTAAPGGSVTLNYTGATVYNVTTAPNEYISAILADSSGNLLYYGRFAQPTSTSGTVAINLPAGLATGNYTLKLFSEQYNGDYMTDYASTFSDVALTVTAPATEVGTWAALKAALNADGNYILTADVAPDDAYWDDALSVPSGVTATLDLNGHIVDRGYRADSTSIWDGSVIKIEGALTVTDSDPTADHGGAADYVDPLTSDTVSVTGGVITGGWADQFGGGVYINGGTFILEGGSIVGNRVGKNAFFAEAGLGGGVYMQSGGFTMSGGAICGNKAVNNAVIEMRGKGGGVYINGGTFEMSGGSVTGNEAYVSGGGVYLASAYSGHSGSLVSGGATVTGNAVGGAANNVYLEDGGKFTVTDALTGTLGVTMMTPGVFTGGLNGRGTAANFVSDDAGYAVSLTDGGEAELAEKPVEKYPLWVGGMQVTSENKDNILGDTGTATAVYDPDTSTLTLTGANITGYHSNSFYGSANVFSDQAGFSLTVELAGENTLRGADHGIGFYTGESATLTLHGSAGAKLTVDSNVDNHGNPVGISARGTLVLDNVVLDCTGLYSVGAGFTGSTVAVREGFVSIGAYGLTVTDSSVTVEDVLYNDGALTVNGESALSFKASSYEQAIWAQGGITLNDGNAILLPTGGVFGALGNGTTVYASDGTTLPGKVVIGKPVLTITADSETKVYDSTALTKGSFTSTALSAGDSIESVTVTGSQTAVGSSANVPGAAKIVNAQGEDVTGCYAITYVPGTLTVTPAALTITAKDQSHDYTGLTQGEGDTAYQDAAQIAEKVTVTGLAGSDALTSIVLDGQATDAGEYAGRIVPSGAAVGEATGNYTITYVPGKLTIRAVKEATPTAVFTATGPDTGTLTGLTDGAQYTVSGAAAADFTLTGATSYALTGVSAGTLSVVKKGDGTNILDSEAQTITVTKAATPNLAATQPTTIGGTGSIPTTAAHQKSTDGTIWTDCDGAWADLAANNTYYVRIKAAGTALASEAQSIAINAFVPTKEATPAAVFTATGADTGTLTGLAAGMTYAIDSGAAVEIIGTSVDLTGLAPCTITVMQPGNSTTTIDSDAQTITVTKAATPTLTAAQPTTIGGTGSIPTTAAHEFSTDGATWTACNGETTGLAAGTYYVRVKASGTVLASEAQSITISAFVPTQEPIPSATFTATGPDSGTLSNVTAGMTYAIDGGAAVAISGTSVDLTGLAPCTITVIQPGNGTTTIDSDAQTITVTKAETPTLTAAQPTTIGGTGSIPTTAAHEFSADGTAWSACTGETSGLAADNTYYVRVKAGGSVLASGAQSITINAFDPAKEIAPAAVFEAAGPDNGTLSGLAAGEKYTISGAGLGSTEITAEVGGVYTIAADVSVGTLSIVKKGNGTTTVDSPAQTIDITKAETPALEATQPTTVGGTGSIPTTAAHEFSADGTAWSACTGVTTGLAAGTYFVRVKAAGTALASDAQGISINAFEKVPQPGVPSGITVRYIGAGFVWLTGVAGEEYVIAPKGTAVPDWTAAITADAYDCADFNGLKDATEYTVFARIAETDYYLPGEAVTLDVTTHISSYGFGGEPLVGGTVSAPIDEVYDRTGVSYQWYLDGTAIVGATEASYVVQESDAEKTLSVMPLKNGAPLREEAFEVGEAHYAAVNFYTEYMENPDELELVQSVDGLKFGDTLQAPAQPARDGFDFVGWQAGVPGEFEDVAFPMTVEYSTDLYAKWTESFYDPDPTPTVETASISVSGDDMSVNVTVQISGSTATITNADIDRILEAKHVGTVVIDLSSLKDTVTDVVIPNGLLTKIADAVADAECDADGLEIRLPAGSAAFDADALAAVTGQTEGKALTFTLTAVKLTELSPAQRDALKDLDVLLILDVHLSCSGQSVSDFRGGTATVSVPCELPDDRGPRGIVAWYAAVDGALAEVPSNSNGKNVVFSVGHFSNYVIAYDAERAAACPKDETCPMSAFTDLDPTLWYHDGIHFCLAGGMMNGVGNGKFDPSGTTNRAMIVTILYRLEKEPEVTGKENPFSDVADGQWYTNAVIWAAENKIVEGYGDGTFRPTAPITREQLAAVLYRYAQSKGQGFTGMWYFLLDYPDAAEISSWADEAMHWCVMKEIIKGKDGKLVPGGDASRAEAATMLMRYCTKIAE